MTAEQKWFSLSPPGGHALECAICARTIELEGPVLDHHPGACPHCAAEAAFLRWKDRTLQVVPARAPAAFAAFLRWAQQQLDELEYVELLCAFETIADAMSAAPCTVARGGQAR